MSPPHLFKVVIFASITVLQPYSTTVYGKSFLATESRHRRDDCVDHDFPVVVTKQCSGLHKGNAQNSTGCLALCCSMGSNKCTIWQFQNGGSQGQGCWLGTAKCNGDDGSGPWNGSKRSKFNCNNGQCTANDNGQYDDWEDCSSKCQTPPPPPPPSPPPSPPSPSPPPPSPPQPAPPPPPPNAKTYSCVKKKCQEDSGGGGSGTSKEVCQKTCAPIPARQTRQEHLGTTILVVFFAGLVVPYIIGGMLFMRFKRDARGVEMFPNRHLWGTFFSLVKDGCQYCYLYLLAKMRGYS
eukprot:m.4012 g.4012  ORF g.4012 m.4012 type:complete len:294 (+) comp2880_c0_seq1:161-1042(+)